jgi:thiol-disulfide isomerase/thioredoxin
MPPMPRRRLLVTTLGVSVLCTSPLLQAGESPENSFVSEAHSTADAQFRTERTSGGEKEEQIWLERLNRADASAAARAAGWAAPPFPDDARWVSGAGPTLEELRGKVIVIQTMSTRGPGKGAGNRLDRTLKDLRNDEDLAVIAVHIPQNLDRAEVVLDSMNMTAPILIDERGTWCDLVGAFERPMTHVIDRRGNLRYAGVASSKLEKAVRYLLAEPEPAEGEVPRARPTKEELDKLNPKTPFPASTGSVSYALDRRNQQSEPFYVESYFLPTTGDATEKVVILDFWATWCGPCIKAIPHMNEIQNHFGREVICLGISDEKNFKTDFVVRKLNKSDFAYGLAVDSSSRMKNFFEIRGIPHAVVLSSDWVVRWQGNPMSLTIDMIQEFVDANASLTREQDPTGALPARRWKQHLEGSN